MFNKLNYFTYLLGILHLVSGVAVAYWLATFGS